MKTVIIFYEKSLFSSLVGTPRFDSALNPGEDSAKLKSSVKQQVE